MNKIHNLDAIEFINNLEDESIDLVLTDPPYNISQKNGFKELKGRAGLDFGEWDIDFDLTQWIEKIAPKVKKGGSLIFFNSWLNIAQMAKVAEENDFIAKDVIRWIKSNPMPRNRDRRYVVDYEFAIWMVKKGDKWTFNRLNDTYDRPELYYSTPTGKRRIHPTQKPYVMLKELIERHTNENDLVVDPFAGSGSTAVACIHSNRQYLINDGDSKMSKRSEKWIKEVEEKIEQDKKTLKQLYFEHYD